MWSNIKYVWAYPTRPIWLLHFWAKSDCFLHFQKLGHRLSDISARWPIPSHIVSLIAFAHKIVYTWFRFYPLCFDSLPPSVLHHKATTTQCQRYTTTECAKVHKVHISARQGRVELCQTRQPIKKESEKCEWGLDGSSRAVDTTYPAEHNRSSVPPVSRHKLFSRAYATKTRERTSRRKQKQTHERDDDNSNNVSTTTSPQRALIKREAHLLLA